MYMYTIEYFSQTIYKQMTTGHVKYTSVYTQHCVRKINEENVLYFFINICNTCQGVFLTDEGLRVSQNILPKIYKSVTKNGTFHQIHVRHS